VRGPVPVARQALERKKYKYNVNRDQLFHGKPHTNTRGRHALRKNLDFVFRQKFKPIVDFDLALGYRLAESVTYEYSANPHCAQMLMRPICQFTCESTFRCEKSPLPKSWSHSQI